MIARAQPRWTPFLPGLLVVAGLAYFRVASAGFIWDDDAHVTAVGLRSWSGLWDIWFRLGATQQYYPLLHSVFWLQHQLWGDAAAGYHVSNVLLHASAAGLLALVLRELRIPGAWLAAAVFALHPVHVESVAWVSEQKNTLSAVFYLGAAYAYLRFDATRRKGAYAAAGGLFLCALLTKSVTATLPAALLVVFWWQRGRLAWRGDVGPLLPWFGVGVAAGLFTAWVEHTYIGASGAAFELTILQRVLLAGRVVVFYATTLLWPANLTFVYPRWEIAAGGAALWGSLAGVVGLTAALWAIRRRTRGPLAAWLFFVGSLFPVLGFFNVYPFQFSYVADHWQYLPSIGLIVLAAAAAATWAETALRGSRGGGRLPGALGLAALAVLTARQCADYASEETLYRATLIRNPAAWLAHNNLGTHLVATGRAAEALTHFETALRLHPGHAETQANLGGALVKLGRLGEAAPYLEAAVRSDTLRRRPNFAELQVNWAAVLMHTNRYAEALPLLEAAIRTKPELREARNLLGWALGRLGRGREALEEFATLRRRHPDFPEAQFGAGYWLAQEDRGQEAVACYEAGLRLAPQSDEAHRDLAAILFRAGRYAEAVTHFARVVELRPESAEAHRNLASALVEAGRVAEAIARFEVGLAINPRDADARANLAIALVRAGRHEEAVAAGEEALRLDPGHAKARQNLERIRARRDSAARPE